MVQQQAVGRHLKAEATAHRFTAGILTLFMKKCTASSIILLHLVRTYSSLAAGEYMHIFADTAVLCSMIPILSWVDGAELQYCTMHSPTVGYYCSPPYS